jgi:hypothetical protein
MYNIDTSEWLTHCPVKTCGTELRIILEGNVYHLWCQGCGWLIEDGIDYDENYISVPDLARAQPELTDSIIRRLIAQDIIPATDFSFSDKSRYMIPIHTANVIIEEGLYWVWDDELRTTEATHEREKSFAALNGG